MPRLIHRALDYPIRAAVIFADGDSKTCAHKCVSDANDWLDRQMYKYGSHIVATDVFDNTI